MARVTRLVVFLGFIGALLMPLATPVAAQQTLPAAFVGRWEGPVDERPSNQRALEIVELSGGNLGDVVGTHDGNFPSGLTCGGPLRLQRFAADGSWAEFAAEITTGAGFCLADGIITLTVQTDGSLSFNWRHPTNPTTVTGSLTRTGGATSPQPTSAPIPTSTPSLVPPMATVAAGGRIVLADDFSDSASSIFAATSPNATQRVSFDAGEFVIERLENRVAGFNVVGAPGPFDDAAVSASARLPTASTTQYVGLGCRVRQSALGPDELYALMVFPALQTFGLIRADNGQSTVITPWATSPALNPVATASNQLELSCVGDTIAARINGVDVNSIQDATYQSGGVVLIVGNDAAGATEARFDDFAVMEISAMLPAPAPTATPAPTAILAPQVTLPPGFLGRWEGTVVWNNATLPVVLDLSGGAVGRLSARSNMPFMGAPVRSAAEMSLW